MLKKFLLIVAIFICMASVPAYAAIDECAVNFTQSSVHVEGTAAPDAQLLLSVVKKGLAENGLIYQDQKMTDESGTFSFDFKMKEAGLYTAYASTPEETYKYDFVFADSDSVKGLIQNINAASSGEDIRTILKENRYAAGLYLTGIEAEPDYSYIAGLVMAGKPYDASNADSVLKLFQQFMLYGYLKDKQVENIFSYQSYLDISSIEGIEVFGGGIFKEVHAIEATNRISGKSFKSYEEFSNALIEQMTLALIMEPNGYGNIEKVCKQFEKRIGIDTSKANITVYTSLYGKNFASFSELKKTFDALCAQISSGSQGNKPGGGSGGGGHTSGSSQGGFVTGTPNTELEQVPIDTTKPVVTVFKDLDGYDWAAESIAELYNKGIVSGRTEDLFAPAEHITRSEFVKLVAVAFDLNAGNGRLPFEDTDVNGWDYPYIKAAYEAGVISGISSIQFGGSLSITRQDMAVILRRAADIAPADDASVKRFIDDNAISDYAYDDVYALRNAGIISGDDANRFNPNDFATRAEAARMIYMAIQP